MCCVLPCNSPMACISYCSDTIDTQDQESTRKKKKKKKKKTKTVFIRGSLRAKAAMEQVVGLLTN